MPIFTWTHGQEGNGLMLEEHKQILTKHRTTLVKTLDAQYIIHHLIEENIITQEMSESIMSKTKRTDQVSELLDLLVRRGSNAFEVFLQAIKDSYDFLYTHLYEEALRCGYERKLSFKEKNTNDHYYYAGIDVLTMIKEGKTRMSAEKTHPLLDIRQDAYYRSPRQKMSIPLPPTHRTEGDSGEIYGVPEGEDETYEDPDLSGLYFKENSGEETYIAVVVKDVVAQIYSKELEASLLLRSEDSGVLLMDTPPPMIDKYLADLQGPQDDVSQVSNRDTCDSADKSANVEEKETEKGITDGTKHWSLTPPRLAVLADDSNKSTKSENDCVHRYSYLKEQGEDLREPTSFDDNAVYEWGGVSLKTIWSGATKAIRFLVTSMPTLIDAYDEDDTPEGPTVSDNHKKGEVPLEETRNTSDVIDQNIDTNSSLDEMDGPIITKDDSPEEDLDGEVQSSLNIGSVQAEGGEQASASLDISTDNVPLLNAEGHHYENTPEYIFSSKNSDSPFEMSSRGSSRKIKNESIMKGSTSDALSKEKISSANNETVELKKNDIVIVETQYTVISGYMKVYDKCGKVLLVPEDCIKRYDDPSGEPWFYPANINTRAAAALLKKQAMGTYIFYKRSDKSPYQLSMVCDQKGKIIHFQINTYGEGCYGFHVEATFQTIQDLQAYYQNNRGRLPCRLRRLPSNTPTAQRIINNFTEENIVDSENLTFEACSNVGRGISGQVTKAKFGDIDVAVKTLQVTDKSFTILEDFRTEAETLLDLKHENIIRCYGVNISENMDMNIVMELCDKRDVRQCLKGGDLKAERDGERLVDMFKQILSALEYLKSKQIIHRDIATRNVFLTSSYKVKLGDFGMARCVVDDVYRAEEHESVPVRWAPQEVLRELRFSSKSDMYAAGITFWEIYSDGKKPYEGLSGVNLTKAILSGQLLAQPKYCPSQMYSLMCQCWAKTPEKRPSAAHLRKQLNSRNYYTNQDYGAQKDKIAEPPSPPVTEDQEGIVFPATQDSESLDPKYSRPTENSASPETSAASSVSQAVSQNSIDNEETGSDCTDPAIPVTKSSQKKPGLWKRTKQRIWSKKKSK